MFELLKKLDRKMDPNSKEIHDKLTIITEPTEDTTFAITRLANQRFYELFRRFTKVPLRFPLSGQYEYLDLKTDEDVWDIRDPGLVREMAKGYGIGDYDTKSIDTLKHEIIHTLYLSH
jgi:hypothetical protein